MKKSLFILFFLLGITQVYGHTSNDGFQYNGVWNETYNHIVIEGDSARYTYIIYMADTIKRKDFRGWGCAGDLRILNNSDSCSAQFISTGAGKGRLYYNYDDNPSDSCKCGIKSVSLDVYKHFNPSAPAYDMEISGPSCILEGDTVVYSIKPILTKHLNAGIGVDQYYWNVEDTTSQSKPSFVDKLIYNAGDGSSVTFVVGEVTGNEEVSVQVGCANVDNILVKSLGKAAPKPSITPVCVPYGTNKVQVSVEEPIDGVIYSWSCDNDLWGFNPMQGSTTTLTVDGNGAPTITVTASYMGEEACNSSKASLKVVRSWSAGATLEPDSNYLYEYGVKYKFRMEDGVTGGGVGWNTPRGWTVTNNSGSELEMRPDSNGVLNIVDSLHAYALNSCAGENIDSRTIPIYMKPATVTNISNTTCLTAGSHTFTITGWGNGPHAQQYIWYLNGDSLGIDGETYTTTISAEHTSVSVKPRITKNDGSFGYGEPSSFDLTFSPIRPDTIISVHCLTAGISDTVTLKLTGITPNQDYQWIFPTGIDSVSSDEHNTVCLVRTNGVPGIYYVSVFGKGSTECGNTDTIIIPFNITAPQFSIQTEVSRNQRNFYIDPWDLEDISSYEWHLNGNYYTNHPELSISKDVSSAFVEVWVTFTNGCIEYAQYTFNSSRMDNNMQQRKANHSNPDMAIAPHIEDVTISPNPAQDQLRIILPNNDEEVLIRIIDLNGRVVCRRKFDKEEIIINTAKFTDGVYTIYISSSDETITKQLIIKH